MISKPSASTPAPELLAGAFGRAALRVERMWAKETMG
jgi:hypothetical protein